MSALMPAKTSGWPAFAAWAICGAMWAFSFLSFAGPIVWPFAAVLTWAASRATRRRADVLGLIAGVGAFALAIGALHVGDVPCDSPRAATADSCGGLDATPWLIVGAVVLVGALVLYELVRRRREHTATV